MDSGKVLYFLGLLNRETSGHEQQLAELFEKALDEDDDICRLKDTLNQCVFYGETGRNLCREGEKYLADIYENPGKAEELLPEIRHAYEKISREVDVCRQRMMSVGISSRTIRVLEKKDLPTYMEAVRAIGSACTYFVLLYGGVDAARALDWEETDGLREKIHRIDHRFFPVLRSLEKPSESWVIRRRPQGGNALFGWNVFYVTFLEPDELKKLCEGVRAEPMGTHAFLNVEAFTSGCTDTPLCWGMGNILSCMPDNALPLLQSGIVTSPRIPQENETVTKPPIPPVCLEQLSDGAEYCVSPDELTKTLNRWQVRYEVWERKQSHRCLFCGGMVGRGRIVCPEHFVMGN